MSASSSLGAGLEACGPSPPVAHRRLIGGNESSRGGYCRSYMAVDRNASVVICMMLLLLAVLKHRTVRILQFPLHVSCLKCFMGYSVLCNNFARGPTGTVFGPPSDWAALTARSRSRLR